jgi:hypothetical protein
MEIQGKITAINDVQSGTSSAGKEWQKCTFIVKTSDEYNNVFCFDVFGAEKVDNLKKYNKVGDDVTVAFNIKCNEFKGKYFTNLDAWKITKTKAEAQQDEALF